MRPWEPLVDEFSRQMAIISSCFTPMSLSVALELMDKDSLPDRAVCVTFDDGYADNCSVASPILRKYKVPATVFVSTDYLDGGMMWNDTVIESIRRVPLGSVDLRPCGLPELNVEADTKRCAIALNLIDTIKYLPNQQRNDVAGYLSSLAQSPQRNLMLTRKELISMSSDDIEIGAHTLSHPILSEISNHNAEREIVESKNVLEDILNKPVRYFAYPNGKPGKDYLQKHRDMVKDAGFEAALSTHHGVSDTSTDRWQLPRFTPWDRTPLKFILRMILNARLVPTAAKSIDNPG